MAPEQQPRAANSAAVASDRGISVCPYLLAADGAWRGSSPSRAHRCVAVDPPARPSTRKQGELCISAGFTGCPTFLAARAAVAALGSLGADARPPIQGRYVVPRTAPVVLDRGSRLAAGGDLVRSPRVGRLVLLALMILTVVALVVARFGGGATGGPGVGQPSDAPVSSPPASVSPSRAPSPSLSPSPEPSPSPASSPSPSSAPLPSVTPSTAATRTYVVKRGDTLSAIAARFDTTVAVIVKLNGIKDPSLIRAGQVLKLP